MSEQPERQYAKDGSFLDGMCECRCRKFFEGIGWCGIFPGERDEHPEAELYWEGVDEGEVACPYCGSYCDAAGHATPGVLVLWEALRCEAEMWACVNAPPKADDHEIDARMGRQLSRICAEARATLAAREGVTP